MNPFDLPGPKFLAFWLGGWVLIVGVAFAIRAFVGRSRARDSADDIAAKLHPTEIAFLLGGIDRAIEAAVAGLHHRGDIELDSDTDRLRVSGKPGATVLKPDGVFRGVIVDEERSRVEAHVLAQLPTKVERLRRGADRVAIVLQRKLEEMGLLVENQRRATHLVRSPAYLWLFVGAVKVAIGLARYKPVNLLVLAMFVAALLMMLLRAPRLTSLGHELAGMLKHRFAALETTARTAPQQLDATDMTLAYGVFGYIVAPAMLMTVMPSYQAVALAATTSASSSSCGGGGGCGSSCGGGGGGGCGGCS